MSMLHWVNHNLLEKNLLKDFCVLEVEIGCWNPINSGVMGLGGGTATTTLASTSHSMN